MQAEQLYQQILQLCELSGNEQVLDAYCGVGVLSLLLAKQAKRVLGIESVEAAVSDAQENSRMNGIHNIEFICGKVEDLISSITDIDAAILNPPRKGCDPYMLKALAQAAPKRVIYVSCDPATLARDLRILSDHGYTLMKAYPFDMFPQTAHVETVALLVKKVCA
jgi:23S rRNA (uracil1939-C5)-methyltransferase